VEEIRKHCGKLWGKTVLMHYLLKEGKIEELVNFLAEWWAEYSRLRDQRYPSEMYRLSRDQFITGIEGMASQLGHDGLSDLVIARSDKIRNEQIEDEPDEELPF